MILDTCFIRQRLSEFEFDKYTIFCKLSKYVNGYL